MSTIAAIATATGTGGIGIIRMSGENCFSILERIFLPKDSSIKIEDVPGYTIKYGYIIDTKTQEKIDEVLVSFFRAPKSYTTENMCEINSHGGMVIEEKILEQCLANGAELAEPGEFTKRAFLNGRMDLAQAESVIDMINAKTEKEAKAAFEQLEGRLSQQIGDIRKMLLNMMADIEASIDYPEYDIEETTNEKALKILLEIREKLVALENSFQTGKILKDGIKTVIVGKPNSGKSSLLNLILGEERAIVSEKAGTTRDTIEEFVKIQNVPLKIIDTAGIRETQDEIEQIGVKRALKLAEDADLIIALFDISKALDEEDQLILDLIKKKVSIVLLNKCDLSEKNEETINIINKQNKFVIETSMRSKKGIEELYTTITQLFKINIIDTSRETIISNIRQKRQISKAMQHINQAIETVQKNMPIDIVEIAARQALEELGYITGDHVSEDIIQEIFSKFCLGK